MSLDVRTLYIVMGVSCFLVSGSFLFFQAHEFRTDGVKEWSAGYAFQGIYWVLLGLRGVIPDFLSIVVANTFLTANYTLLYAAVREFQRRSYRRNLLFLPAIVTTLYISFFWAYIDSISLRTVYISLVSGIQMGFIASILFREVHFQIRRSQWLTGCFFAAGAALWFIRFLEWSASPLHEPQSFGPSIVLTALLVLGFGVVVLTSIGFLLMIRERAGEAVRESEQRWATTLASIGDAVIATDTAGNITFMNAVAEQLTGWTLHQAAQKPAKKVFNIVNERTRETVEDPVSRVLDSGTMVGLANHTILVRRDGTEVPIDDSGAPIRDQNGNIIGVVLVFRDITERMQAEEKLRKSEEKYLKTFQSNPACVGLSRLRDGLVIEANDVMLKLLGYSNNEFIGHTILELGIWNDLADRERMLETVMTEGRSTNQEYWLRTKTGELLLCNHSAEVIQIGDVPHIIFTFFDITDRKLAEEAVQESERRERERAAALEEINKELESFSYSISHDLRAPLRAIDGYARMILKKQGDKFDEDTARKFNDIRSNVQMMGKLIDDILTLSRLGRAKMSIVNLEMEGIINDVWKELQTINPERNMTLTIQAMPFGFGDRTLIRQVYSNLLANAVKFTKYKNPAQIETGGYIDGNDHIYYVKDNGVGFDMAYYDKLFGIFQRLHNNPDFEGTGVGLATIQRVVHMHGGHVWAQGKVNEGATFYFALPHKSR